MPFGLVWAQPPAIAQHLSSSPARCEGGARVPAAGFGATTGCLFTPEPILNYVKPRK